MIGTDKRQNSFIIKIIEVNGEILVVTNEKYHTTPVIFRTLRENTSIGMHIIHFKTYYEDNKTSMRCYWFVHCESALVYDTFS